MKTKINEDENIFIESGQNFNENIKNKTVIVKGGTINIEAGEGSSVFIHNCEDGLIEALKGSTIVYKDGNVKIKELGGAILSYQEWKDNPELKFNSFFDLPVNKIPMPTKEFLDKTKDVIIPFIYDMTCDINHGVFRFSEFHSNIPKGTSCFVGKVTASQIEGRIRAYKADSVLLNNAYLDCLVFDDSIVDSESVVRVHNLVRYIKTTGGFGLVICDESTEFVRELTDTSMNRFVKVIEYTHDTPQFTKEEKYENPLITYFTYYSSEMPDSMNNLSDMQRMELGKHYTPIKYRRYVYDSRKNSIFMNLKKFFKI